MTCNGVANKLHWCGWKIFSAFRDTCTLKRAETCLKRKIAIHIIMIAYVEIFENCNSHHHDSLCGNIVFRHASTLFGINPKCLWIFQPNKNEDQWKYWTNYQICQLSFPGLSRCYLTQLKTGMFVTFDKDCTHIS